MKITRVTLILGVVALASLMTAMWLNGREFGIFLDAPGSGEPLVPGAAELLSPVSEIHVRSSAHRTTLKRGEHGWTVLEKSAFAADTKKVSALLEAVMRSKKVEPKTSERSHFARMGLGDDATTISLYDSAGALLFSLDLGRQFQESSSGRLLSYAFFEGLERAWTASGFASLDSDPQFWILHEPLMISSTRIKRVAVSFGARKGLVLSRQQPNAIIFESQELGGTADPKIVNALAFALSSFVIEDVDRGREADLFSIAKATYTTFDGLELTLQFYDFEGAVWLTFEALYRPEILEEKDTPNLLPDVPQDGVAEATALNTRLGGWRFRLNSAKVADILKGAEDLISQKR